MCAKNTDKKTHFQKLITQVKEFSGLLSAITIILASVFTVVNFAFSQLNKETSEHLEKISSKMKEVELGTTRTQLMTLINYYPTHHGEILQVAKYYFKELKGDWYMSSIFHRWAEQQGIDVSSIVKISE